GDLDEGALSFLEQLLDGRVATRPGLAVAVVLVVVLVGRGVASHVRDVEKRRLLGADVHEGGLDPWQDGLDLAEVDVADEALPVGPVHHQLDQDVVLQDGHARFLGRGGNEDLSLHTVWALSRTGSAGAVLTMRRPRAAGDGR